MNYLYKKKSLEEKDNKNKNLNQEIEALKSQYNDILNKYNNQNLIIQNKQKEKDDAFKNIEEKYKYLKKIKRRE